MAILHGFGQGISQRFRLSEDSHDGSSSGGSSSGSGSGGLTFAISDTYPETVLESDEKGHRLVGRRGGNTVYAIKAQKLSGEDIKALVRVKSLVIEDRAGQPALTPTGIEQTYGSCLAQLNSLHTNESKETLAYLLSHDISGYGPVSILLEDKANLEEIEINSPESDIIVYHSKYGRCATNLRFKNEGDFRFTINRMITDTTKELNSSFPVIDAHLGDGSRLHAQLRPYAISGAAATIRLGNKAGADVKSLLVGKTLTADALAYLWLAVEAGCNMLIAGAPASGKTSLLLALNAFAPRFQRIVTVEEDINELKFYSNFINVISLQGSSKPGEVDLRDQVINALHMRPERLIVGELRGGEASDVFAGANLGIPFMATLHSSANGIPLLNRLKGKPMSVEPFSLGMLDMSVFMRQKQGSSRIVDDISEYSWLSNAEITAGSAETGVSIRSVVKEGNIDADAMKESKVIKRHSENNLISAAATLKELKKRARFLHELAGSGAAYTPEQIARYWEIR